MSFQETFQSHSSNSEGLQPAVQPTDPPSSILTFPPHPFQQIFSAESGVTSVSHVPAGSCTPSSPLFQSPQLGAPGLGVGQETFDYTFTAPGTYEFASVEHCAAGMKGSITVIASGLPEIPAEFEGATPAESVPLPDNGVITVAPTTTKKLTQQTPPPNVVAGTSPAATATATAGGNGGGAQPTTKPNSAQKLGQVAGLAGAVVAGALALL